MNTDNSMFRVAHKDLIRIYVLSIWIKNVDDYKTLSDKQKEYLEKVVFTNRAFLDANIEKSSNYKIENSFLINKNNQQSIEVLDYNSTENILEPVGKIGKSYLDDADVSKFIFCSGKAPNDETLGATEQAEIFIIQDERQDLLNSNSGSFLDKVIVPTGMGAKPNIFKSLPENWNFNFEKGYWINRKDVDFKDATFGTTEQVINNLLSERIKAFVSTTKNKKADYKNNKYENKAKKAALSPLLKNLIKNIK